MENNDFINEIKRLKAIADIGLLYCKNEYDKERYLELKNISLSLFNKISGHSFEALQECFPIVSDYPTAKVDIRGLALSTDKKILLVKEQADGKWSLPGGWADIGNSPKETIINEFKEETGLDIIPKALLAVLDKRFHAHPPQPFYVYKMVFYCELVSVNIQKGFDVLDVQFFDINELPELSEDRILRSQIEFIYQKVLLSDWQTHVD